MVICDVESAGSVSTPLGKLVRSRVVQEDCAPDHALAVFVAELFAILHPAVLPMLERMFEDVRLDAENDGELGLSGAQTWPLGGKNCTSGTRGGRRLNKSWSVRDGAIELMVSGITLLPA